MTNVSPADATPNPGTAAATGSVGAAAPRAAAFFDLDGTLIRGSSNIRFALAGFRRGFVTPKELAKDLRNGLSFLLHGATDERSVEVRDRILAAVKGHEVAEVVALGDDFLDDLVEDVRPEALGLLAGHARAHRPRVVISASPTEIVSRLARELGLEHGIGTTSRIRNGRYTGELEGPFCYGQGKAEVMRAMARDHGWDLDLSYAYSDSASDLPMLRAVGNPVAVNPDKRLRTIATAEGWPIVETTGWRSARKRDLPRLAFVGLKGAARPLAQLLLPGTPHRPQRAGR